VRTEKNSFTGHLLDRKQKDEAPATKQNSNKQKSMADATAQAPAPSRAIPELPSGEKPSHASSLAEPEAPHARKQAGFFSRRRMLGPVVKEYGDYGLLATSFVTGMVDGASFLNWGVFVGMQTGKSLLGIDRRLGSVVGSCVVYLYTCIHIS
jgi:hypothetical protein